MACTAPTFPSTKGTTNYARLCRLLVDAGTQVLREKFDAIHPPANLHSILMNKKAALQLLREKKVINTTQWEKLFPVSPSLVSSANFDITLLMALLRNVCSLPPPALGWDVLPNVEDLSLVADIARVKHYRNNVYGHADCASVDDAKFHKYWGDIRDTLVRLGGPKYKAAIGNLETNCMDPEVESLFIEALRQWEKDEDNVKDKLDEILKKLDNFKIPGSSLEKKRRVEGKSSESEEMSESTAMCRERLHEPAEPVNCFCENCKVCICEKCGQTRHARHTKVSIQKAAEEEKLKLRNAVEKGKLQIAELERQIQETSELFQVSKEKIAAARNDVCTTIEELTRVLKEHENLMLSELSILEERQQSHHSIQHEHLQASVKELESVVRNCDTTLQSNADFDALQAQIIEIEKSKRVLKAKQIGYYKPCHVGYLRDEKYIQDFSGAAPGKILASKTDPSRSLITGQNLEIAEAGRIKEFNITTTDSFGEPCYLEVDDIKVRVCNTMGKYVDGEVDDWHSTGKYNVTFTPDCAGEHQVTVLVNDQPLPHSPWKVSVRPHNYIFSFNFASLTRKHRNFKEPCALAIDNKTKKIAVADRNNRVQIFDLNDSQYLKELGEKGPAGIKLSNPTSVAFTNSGEVVVISSGTMFCFTTDGTFFGCINNKHLKVPFSLTIAFDGQMVVCDIGDKSIKVLSPDGKDLLQFFSIPDSDDSPWEAVCHQDKFFVSYPTARCVKAFDRNGRFLYEIGKENSSEGQLQKPRGLAIDTFNNLVVCDEEHKTLNVFSLDGTLLNTVSSTKIDCPWSIAVSSAARWPFLIMADPRKRSVLFFH